jgi:hypothetical protein
VIEGDSRTFFEQFVTNAHDAEAVALILWDSPDFLRVSRGTQARGTKAAMELFCSYYIANPTWQFFSAVLADGVVQVLVPVAFTRGVGGYSAAAIFTISGRLTQHTNHTQRV